MGGVGAASRAEEGRVSGPEGAGGPAEPDVPAGLRLADLDYDLPEELVAQAPAEPRDASRLLVCRRAEGHLEDRLFSDLPALLREGDVLVRNDTRVFPARSFFRRATGGRIEVLFLRPYAADEDGPGSGGRDAPAEGDTTEVWEALLRGRPLPGETLTSEALAEDWPLVAVRPLGDGRWLVASRCERPVLELLEGAGVMPLPPYIHRPASDPERYQTTYARLAGSAAAPTAGLHFTPALDRALAASGVTIESLTLHVGLGTFKPLVEETLATTRLHSETYEVAADVWARLRAARAEGRRIVAVGTTSVRTLEHLARHAPEGAAPAGLSPDASATTYRGDTSLFIAPGFAFRMVDALVTNFHLPRTSLLALVMAFCGTEQTRRLYAHAVRERYRFYSFGDAMLAL
jgi:S-adenosylmethionine:tRNA ribosyltransferase-isomerase